MPQAREEVALITTRVYGTIGLAKVEGRLTFQDYDSFKTKTELLLEGQGVNEIDLDLSAATYMDSNALGMLISLREKAQAKSVSIKLVRPSPSIRAIFEMVQFEKLFQIVE